MRFINRESELQSLNQSWKKDKPQLIVIYGKRRVGKTELSIHFAQGKPHIYFLCDRTSMYKQLQKFTEMIAKYFKDEFLPSDGFKDWIEAFKYIVHKNQKMTIVIDEFPYLAETDKAIPSIFQKIWDLYLKNSKIYLMLQGSSIAMMEKTLLVYKAPLYGRRTGQLLLKPFQFKEVMEMFPDKSFEEVLSIYSIVGGTPLYLNKFIGKGYVEVVKNEILQKGQPLYEEVEFLLREELKEPRNYFVILEALSLGKRKLSEIINETGFDKGTVSRYISILDSLQITSKEIPVTEKIPEKSRKGIYRIDDNFFNFWFMFVFRNRSFLEEGRIDEVVTYIQKTMPMLLAQNYEKIAKEILIRAFHKSKISLSFEFYGRWWNKDKEIDLVATNYHINEILFGEVKWSNKQVGTNIYEDLKKKAQAVQWGKEGRKEHFAIFSKSGFTKDMIALARKDKVFLIHKDKLKI